MKAPGPDTDYYAIRYRPDRWRSVVWREIVRALARYIPQDAAVVELGPGYCDFINQLPAARKVAIDINPLSREYADADVELIVGDVAELGESEPGSMDLVLASNLLEHLERAEGRRLLRLARTVLRPNGKLILIQPNFRYSYDRYYDDHTHVTPYTHSGLCGLVESEGFRVVACVPRFLPLSMNESTWIPRYGWIVRLYLRLPVRPLARQMLIVAEKPGDQ